MMVQFSAETRAEKRSVDLQAFDDKDNVFEKHLTKPRKGQQARFYIAGTKGAEICDELLDVVDESVDLVVTKHHYSAFDQTSLLNALRAKLVTEIYLCGCLTNVGVYSTAADAVQHGLQVTVVEDCLGYRNEDKHEEAMQQMADIMGVYGIDSEEIIEESGGRPVPDAVTPGITLEELSIKASSSPQPDPRAEEKNSATEETPARTSRPRDDADFSVQTDRAMTEVEPTDLTAQSGLESAAPISQPLHEHEKLPSKDDLDKQISPGPSSSRNRSSWNFSRSHNLGPGDTIGSGDSKIIYNITDHCIANSAFTKLKDEVGWQTMFHRGGTVPRLVAVQGELGPNGEIPIYRHPADESPPLLPFTSTIQQIRETVESLLSQKFNHALIQLYRNGTDNISEHSDKTLDICRKSSIVNVSIGAQRVMTLRTKKSKQTQGTDSPSMRQSQRIKMPHNSAFVLGPQTNMEWLHGVRADKRPEHERSEEEKAFSGERISITFRQIGTFISKDRRTIWGAGARSKRKGEASRISNNGAEMEAMIYAFGKENHNTDFDWGADYGNGFDVVNLINEQAKVLLCSDATANNRIQLALFEKSISFKATKRGVPEARATGSNKPRFHPWMHGLSNSNNPIFHDVDDNASTIEGDLAILFYLEKYYPFSEAQEISSSESGPLRALVFKKIAQSNDLLFLWRELRDSGIGGQTSPPTTRFRLEKPVTPDVSLYDEFHAHLGRWEKDAETSAYIAGEHWTIIDCAFWPVLNELVVARGEVKSLKYPHLLAYHERVLYRESVKALLEGEK